MAKVRYRYPMIPVALLALAACRQDQPAPTPSPTPTATASATATATPHASGARTVVEETDEFRFEYAYPAEAGNIPALAELLDARLERLRSQLAEQAAQGREDARGNGFPFNKYSTGVTWQVVADTPRFLSLSADVSSYTGGAHGNRGFDTLVWDRDKGVALQPAEFFTSLAALDEALGERLCELLNRERAARRGPDAKGFDGPFADCVPLSDTTVLLGSRNKRSFDRIGVLIGPYVAGPYAEGTWEFTLPVDAAVLEAVAPEYRAAFTARN